VKGQVVVLDMKELEKNKRNQRQRSAFLECIFHFPYLLNLPWNPSWNPLTLQERMKRVNHQELERKKARKLQTKKKRKRKKDKTSERERVEVEVVVME